VKRAHGSFLVYVLILMTWMIVPSSGLVFANPGSNAAIVSGVAALPEEAVAGTYYITASAGIGGRIAPAGKIAIGQGQSRTFIIHANTGYKIASVIVDGASVGSPSSYTFTSVTASHSIKANFARDYDYYGLQQGNRFSSTIKQGGRVLTGTETVSLASSASPETYLVYRDSSDGHWTKEWYQKLSEGLGLKKMQDWQSGATFSPPLIFYKNPLRANLKWVSRSTSVVRGQTLTWSLTAAVAPKVLVSVPAGKFLAFPVSYRMVGSGPGGTEAIEGTDYFVPYIGTVKSHTRAAGTVPETTEVMTRFETAYGTVSLPPPVIRAVTPSSGAVGTLITITGYQFRRFPEASVLEIGDAKVTDIRSWKDTAIECIVPAGASTGAVSLKTHLWPSNQDIKFTVKPSP
jgi:hypothetical protein